jgi:DNA topoisomerase-3
MASRPVPLATVEMQKNLSRAPFRFTSTKTMEIAEKLYQRGYLSYPRTETDSFKEGTYLEGLIRLQTTNPQWGAYAQTLVDGGRFLYPRNGGHDDGQSECSIHTLIVSI